jgi:bifunctional non-homologous end joining protein LigD
MAKKNPLKLYNEKRDFSKTREPKGVLPKKKGKKLKFVVQEHHATRLHFDLRLELEGVLKSWAVPKGPSLDPSVKRLAMQTEDHPLGYEKFHGVIPEGEYGAGEMFIYDQGTWEPESEDPIAAIEKGDLKFKLHGKKLKGSFVLVRTHWRDESGKSWLLIKHKDEFVQEGDEVAPIASYGSRREAPKEIFKKAAKKAKKIAKKVSKGFDPKKKVKILGRDRWPDFIAPQLPRLVDEPPQGKKWIHEMKFDGYRIQVHLKNGKARLYTRRGLDWSESFPHLLSSFENLAVESAIIDGEIVALDEKGRTNFQRLQNSFKSHHDTSLMYYAFDLLYLNGKDLRDLPLKERKAMLAEELELAPESIKLSESFETDADEFYRVSCEHELEGIISKVADAPYHSGRNDLWVKTKCSTRQEFVIGGWTDPQGGRTGLGALLVGIYENDELRYAGKVGTGFNTESLREIRDTLRPLEKDESPFDINSPRGKGIHWVEPSKVCEINFANWTNDKILRTPVFMGMREDKSPKEIGMEKPKSIKSVGKKTKEKVAAKKRSPTKKKGRLSEVREISSPEKILFKKEGKTKQDVANFYREIANHMLPYMEDRPLSLVRCPNGSDKPCFFQKHFVDFVPESFHTFPVEEGDGFGTYSSIDSVAGLMDLVQMNAFEIHAWNCHKDTYMYPDQIVMDFDPGPDVPWSKVVDAAFEVKEMLEDLNLKSFVKFTGGKGLHVHIPVAPLYDWDQIKSFAQTLALQMVSNNPKLYVANMAKSQRNGKIFVDYLRNGYGATAVVPYSLRAKPTSAIAMPVEWSQLRKIKSPQEFTMDKALKWLKARKKDPWAGMLKLKQKISILKPVKKVSKKAA